MEEIVHLSYESLSTLILTLNIIRVFGSMNLLGDLLYGI